MITARLMAALGTVLTVVVLVGVLAAQNVQRSRAAVQLVGTWSATTTVAYSWSVGAQQDDGVAERSPWGVQTVADVGDVVVLVLKPVDGTPAANHTLGTVKVNGVVQRYCPADGSLGAKCVVKITAGMLARGGESMRGANTGSNGPVRTRKRLVDLCPVNRFNLV